MAIIIHKESKGNNNGREKIPADNIPFQTKIKGEDMEEKEEIVKPTPSESNREREPLPLPSLHKAVNPYRPQIPLTCRPKEVHNDKKTLKLKDPRRFMVNISIGGKEIASAMLDLGARINIMPYSIYLRLGLGKLKLTSMTLQLADGSIKHTKGLIKDLMVQMGKFKVLKDFVVLEMQGAPLRSK